MRIFDVGLGFELVSCMSGGSAIPLERYSVAVTQEFDLVAKQIRDALPLSNGKKLPLTPTIDPELRLGRWQFSRRRNADPQASIS